MLSEDVGASTPPPKTGAQIYAEACASCHGPDGTGMPGPTVGFDVPLPDFSDCSFSTREPTGDWYAVVHEGGPARAFDKLMPAFGDALSAAEIQKAVDHLRTFCDERESWPIGDLNMPLALRTAKAFPEDEAVLMTGVTTEGNIAVMNKLSIEKRVGARGQVEVTLPFGFLDRDQEGWTGGIGDIGLSTKWAVLHSRHTGSIFSVAAEVILPTGREDRGLGSGVTFIEPYLAFGQLLPADSFLQLQVGGEISTEPDDAEHEVYWRGVLGTTFTQGRFGRAWSPMVEILGARGIEDEATTTWTAVPQLQVSLPTRQHILLCAGVLLPINDFDARPTEVLAYLLWDWFDGPFFEGW